MIVNRSALAATIASLTVGLSALRAETVLNVSAGIERVVVLPGRTWLSGKVAEDGKPQSAAITHWSKSSGPGEVVFADSARVDTTATFSAPGDYVLTLAAQAGPHHGEDALHVTVVPPPPVEHLHPIAIKHYKVTSPLLRERLKQTIIHWIPHCCAKLSNRKTVEEKSKDSIGADDKPDGRLRAIPWGNSVTYNIVESMCWARMLDAQGDTEIEAAQEAMRLTLDDWIPRILSDQSSDGYLESVQTARGRPRWTNKKDHEGYRAGYFIEAGLAHYLMTDKRDDRLYRAARRLADCWYDNLGPAGKRKWYDGHEGIEQALVSLGQLARAEEGPTQGQKYIDLAKCLLDNRGNGEEYDQSHLPVTQQYEAVGHAVRAAYCYSGMAGVAMETGNLDYHSALLSIWANLVHKRYYVTGGIGSGESSEGFGPNYSLPNDAYCESCANCGELFFQHKMNAIHRDGRFADLYEETFYNAILGDLDLEGRNFTYTNPLDTGESRYPWHGCPCCVGNIPRTLLMLPSWMYATGKDSLYVNLFVGSTVTVEDLAGTQADIEQTTDYPWHGKVSITVRPKEEKRFSIHLRVPSRNVSLLYTSDPKIAGLISLSVNGVPRTPRLERGYAVLDRLWKPGDRIDLELPLVPQRIKALDRVVANRGRVALRYGPLIYNIEGVDQNVDGVLGSDSALTAEWRSDLLGGVLVLRGTFTDGTPLLAIPNYARNNRGGRSLVWIRDR